MKCLGQSGGGAFEVAESRSKHGGRESAQGVSSGCMGHASQVIVFCTYNLDIIYIYIYSIKESWHSWHTIRTAIFFSKPVVLGFHVRLLRLFCLNCNK